MDKLGIALVGLGKYASQQLAPALQQTEHCRLAGIVTGSPQKKEEWKARYGLKEESCYSYDTFDTIKDNPEIDIVYVVLPNSMHREYVLRAAAAGKHVICEKPMALTAIDCQEMIDACRAAGRRLSIGYRLHFEPYNRSMMELHQSGKYGRIQKIRARNGMNIEPGVWRLNKALAGGGPLMDVGIYCVQGALYTMGEEPVAVTAREGEKTDPGKFREVEQSLTWIMEFPSGAVAECETSYAAEMNELRAECDQGWQALEPAYPYEGIKGKSSGGTLELPQINQQAAQMDDFARCVRDNAPSRVPGEMGLRDVKILQAIYESMRTGRRVEIA